MQQDCHCGQDPEASAPTEGSTDGQAVCEVVCQVRSQIQVPGHTQVFCRDKTERLKAPSPPVLPGAASCLQRQPQCPSCERPDPTHPYLSLAFLLLHQGSEVSPGHL